MPERTLDGRSLCGVIHPDGTDCQGPPMAGAPINVCTEHMMQAYLHIRDQIIAHDGKTFQEPWTRPDTCLVYYVRNGDLIKIGYTWNLWQRMNKIPGMLLAAEPGSPEIESQRHEQFAALRVGRNAEWFQDGPDLMRHIHGLRKRYGDPVDRRYEAGRARPLWRLLLDSTDGETPR